MKHKAWFVYIAECADGTYYTGITTSVADRIATHNTGNGAKYTRSRLPISLRYFRKCSGKSEASILEHTIKQLSRSEKETLLQKYGVDS